MVCVGCLERRSNISWRPRKLWVRLKCKTHLIFVVKRLLTCRFAVFCTVRVLVEKHCQELTVQRRFTCNWVSPHVSEHVRPRSLYNADNAETLMRITFSPIQVWRLFYYPAIQVTSQFDSSSVVFFLDSLSVEHFIKLSEFLNTFKLRDLQFISTHPTSRQRTLINRSTNRYFPFSLSDWTDKQRCGNSSGLRNLYNSWTVSKHLKGRFISAHSGI